MLSSFNVRALVLMLSRQSRPRHAPQRPLAHNSCSLPPCAAPLAQVGKFDVAWPEGAYDAALDAYVGCGQRDARLKHSSSFSINIFVCICVCVCASVCVCECVHEFVLSYLENQP